MYTFELLEQGAQFEIARIKEMGLPSSPHLWYFGVEPNPEIYKAILPYIITAHRYENFFGGFNEEEIAIYAAKLACVFSQKDDALEYIKYFFKREVVNPVSTACGISLPGKEIANLPRWQAFAKKFLTKPLFQTVLRHAASIEAKLETMKEEVNAELVTPRAGRTKPLSLRDAIKFSQRELAQLEGKKGGLQKLSKKSHKDVTSEATTSNEDLQPAPYAVGFFKPESVSPEETLRLLIEQIEQLKVKIDFWKKVEDPTLLTLEDLVALAEEFEYPSKTARQHTESLGLLLENKVPNDAVEKYLSIDKTQAGKLVPHVVVHGTELAHTQKEYIRYYMMKLPATDLRAAVLGDLTGCCQSIHIDGGKEFVEIGLSNPHYGFYVLFKGNSNDPKFTDEVCAQSIVWLNQEEKALVFDSIESPLSLASVPSKVEMIVAFYQHLSDKLIAQSEQEIACVLVGAGVAGQTFNRAGYEPLTALNVTPPAGSPIYDSEFKRIFAKKMHDSIEEQLFYAVNRGDKQNILLLLQQVDGDRKNLLTRLVRAAIFQDQADLAHFLCEQGEVDEDEILKPFVKGWYVVSPLNIVAMTGTAPMLEFLFSRFPKSKELLDVVYLDRGKPGLLPLESAIARGDKELITRLIFSIGDTCKVYNQVKVGVHQLTPLLSRINKLNSCESVLSQAIINGQTVYLEKLLTLRSYSNDEVLSAFAEALLLLDYAAIKLLLAHGVGNLVDQPIPRLNHISILKYVVRFNLLRVLQQIIESDFSSDRKIDITSIMRFALESGAFQSAEFLMQLRTDLLLPPMLLWRAAIKYGQFKLLMSWVQADKLLDVTRPLELQKLAIEAIQAGNAAALDYFFRKGIDVPVEEILSAFNNENEMFKANVMQVILEHRYHLVMRSNPLDVIAPKFWQEFATILLASKRSNPTDLLLFLCELEAGELDALLALRNLDTAAVSDFINFLADQGADLNAAADRSRIVNRIMNRRAPAATTAEEVPGTATPAASFTL